MKHEVEFLNMPLAVYREVAAHLRQVEGVSVELRPQTAKAFDYTQSQVGGLCLEVASPSPPQGKRLGEILTYYGDRYPLHPEDVIARLQAPANA
ncbi:MAG: hypothetical protein VKJ85_13335 [Prochlorothrix sp.]|nr:hypothetical protein [Prochlorothrix sp.]